MNWGKERRWRGLVKRELNGLAKSLEAQSVGYIKRIREGEGEGEGR